MDSEFNHHGAPAVAPVVRAVWVGVRVAPNPLAVALREVVEALVGVTVDQSDKARRSVCSAVPFSLFVDIRCVCTFHWNKSPCSSSAGIRQSR